MKNLLVAFGSIVLVAGIVTWGMRHDATLATYHNDTAGFSFEHPTSSIFFSDADRATMPWSYFTRATETGTVLVAIDIPEELQPETNFREAKFSVSASDVPDVVANCTVAPYENVSTHEETIENVPFIVFSGEDAGAGNYYAVTSYRTVRDGKCFAVEYGFHWTNLMNYPTELNLHEFDRAAIESYLKTIAKTFRFTN